MRSDRASEHHRPAADKAGEYRRNPKEDAVTIGLPATGVLAMADLSAILTTQVAQLERLALLALTGTADPRVGRATP